MSMILPPHNLEAEQSVIGSILLDAQSESAQKVFTMLKPESFYNRAHQTIFGVLKDMSTKNQTIDGLTVSDELEKRSLLQQVGGFAYLMEIVKFTPSSANMVAYACVVRDSAMERYGIATANQMTELLYARNGMSTREKFESIQTLFSEITDHVKTGKRRGARPLGDVMADWLDEVDQRFSDTTRTRGIRTGIPSLDELLQPKGLVRGSLMVIGARPKMGKTTLYSQLALNCALHENLPAVLFSLEMPDKQIFERMIGQSSGINTDIFYCGTDNDNDFAYANAKALEMVESGNLFVDDTPGASLSHIIAESRRIKRQCGKVGMVLVDYLTLMRAEKADRNDLAYGIITKGLKNLAKELDCIVVLLTQLNRDLEKRVNKRPQPSDSRDTGQIEQDCDYWLGIYREGAYDENANQQDTELLLRLNRHGRVGVVFVEQKNGAIYDCDQNQMRTKAEAASKKQGRF
ncbi:DnaB-like helicase C-terminal domain-containing protein [Sodalis endosymbiont of Spalangia cameroni]|uniref:DnaB-like helicase C-terminal domain-containing protein n=1 Tax=Sodalis praecaptivus TaxID=1239307 RepID=UPI0031F9AADE